MSITIPVEIYTTYNTYEIYLAHHDLIMPNCQFKELPKNIKDKLKEYKFSRLCIYDPLDTKSIMFVVNYKTEKVVSEKVIIPSWFKAFFQLNRLKFSPEEYEIGIITPDKWKELIDMKLSELPNDILSLFPWITSAKKLKDTKNYWYIYNSGIPIGFILCQTNN